MNNIRKKKTAHLRPLLPTDTLTDHIDWNKRIFQGQVAERLNAVFEAKEKKDVNALPALIKAAGQSGEVALEAFDAIEAIITHNPGDENILRIACGLDLGKYQDMWMFSIIADANPDAEVCTGRVPGLMEELNRLLENRHDLVKNSLHITEIVRALEKLGGNDAIPVLEEVNRLPNLPPNVQSAVTMALWELYTAAPYGTKPAD